MQFILRPIALSIYIIRPQTVAVAFPQNQTSCNLSWLFASVLDFLGGRWQTVETRIGLGIFHHVFYITMFFNFTWLAVWWTSVWCMYMRPPTSRYGLFVNIQWQRLLECVYRLAEQLQGLLSAQTVVDIDYPNSLQRLCCLLIEHSG